MPSLAVTPNPMRLPDPALFDRRGRRVAWWVVWGFVLANVAWRVIRMAIDQPLWGDETMLATNLQVRGFGELTRPMMWTQLAPPGFLWLMEACTRVFGFGSVVLRAWPMLAGVAATAVFAVFAWRSLRRTEAVVATAWLAASHFPVRHSLEFKPYSTDLLVAALAVWATVELARRPSVGRWVALAAVGVVGVWMSFPGVLAIGGCGLWLLWRYAGRGERKRLATAVAVGGAVAASYAVVFWLLGDTRSKETGHYREMDMWAGSFPPWDRPWMVPVWLIEMHTGRMLAHPNGGKNLASTGTLLLCVYGGVRLWRTGRRSLLGLLLAPFGLGLLAAGLGQYPYGGSTRTMLYVAPAVCALAGVGAAGALRRLGVRRARAGVAVVLVLLGAVLVAHTVREFVRPYRHLADLHTREAMADLGASSNAGDVWVFLRTRPSVSGRAGEWQLRSGQSASSIQFYAQAWSSAELRFAADDGAGVGLEAFERVVLLDHGPADAVAEPEAEGRALLDAMRQRFGAPEVRPVPLGKSAKLMVYVFDGRKGDGDEAGIPRVSPGS